MVERQKRASIHLSNSSNSAPSQPGKLEGGQVATAQRGSSRSPSSIKKDPQVSNRVRIYTLLVKGWQRKDIIKAVGVSETRVREITAFYEGIGLIKKVSNYPALYARTEKIRTPHHAVEHPQGYAYILPHHVGAQFRLLKKLPLGLYQNGIKVFETRAHTVTFRQKTADIWLHHFRGSSPDEILKNAQDDILALADTFARKYSVQLSLKRLIPYIEWADTDEERSAEICAEAEIKKNEWLIVDGAKHKNMDETDDTLEIEPAPGHPVTRPTLHARRHHALYSGEYEKRIDRTEELLEKIASAMEKQTVILDKLTDLSVATGQRLEMKVDKK